MKLEDMVVVLPDQKGILPDPINKWKMLTGKFIVEYRLKIVPYNLATLILDVYESMGAKLKEKGYRINVDPEMGFEVDVLVDINMIYIAVGSILWWLSIAARVRRDVSLVAENNGIKIELLSDENLQEYFYNVIEDRKTADEHECALRSAVDFIRQIRGEINFTTKGILQTLSIKLPIVAK